jgi:hypothetical protein
MFAVQPPVNESWHKDSPHEALRTRRYHSDNKRTCFGV